MCYAVYVILEDQQWFKQNVLSNVKHIVVCWTPLVFVVRFNAL